MANSTTIKLNIKTVADISDVKHNVDEIQKAINSLKLSPELKASFDKVFSDVTKQADKAMSMKEAGFKNKGEAAAYEKTIDSINRLLIQLDSNLGKISEKDLKRSLTIDPEKLKHAQQAIHDIQEELSKRIDASGLKAVTDAADRMSKLSKSGGIQEFVEAFSKGDFEGAQAALKKLEDTANRFKDDNRKIAFTGELEKLKAAFHDLSGDEGVKFLVQKLKEAEFNLENLNTEELEKLKTIFEQLASKVLPETAKGMRDYGDSTSKSAREQGNLNSELDSFKSKITYFFGMNNAVQLFQRAIRAAYETVKDLDAIMTETAVVTNFSVGDMWSQLPEYTQRANELGVSIHSAYESATLFYQQGLNNNEVMQISAETLKMARIAGLNAATATDRMTNALRGFNMELNQANAKNVADVYSKLAAITASNVDEISTAMTKVASLANNANMEFETTAAFLSQIIETTRESAETAGTALKTVIARFSEVKKLYDQGELLGKDEEGEEINVNKVSEALRTAGINLNEFLTGAKGLDDIFIELSSKWDSLDKVQQRYIATIAAGSRQQSRFIALMSDYKRTIELVNAANNAAGASQQQYEKTLESLRVKLTKLQNAWDSFLMQISDNEVIKGIVDTLTLIITKFNELTGDNALTKIAAVFNILKLGKVLFDKLFKTIGDSIGEKAREIARIYTKEVVEQLRKDSPEIEQAATKGFDDAVGKRTKAATEESKKIEAAINGINIATMAAGLGLEHFARSMDTTTNHGEQLSTVLSGIGQGIGTAASAMSLALPLLKTLGVSFIGSIPQFTIVLGIITAITAALYGLYNYMKKNSLQGKLESLNKLTESIKANIQTLDSEVNELISANDSLQLKYAKIEESLKNITLYSKEWKELVSMTNMEALELLEKYPELNAIYENGTIRFTNYDEVVAAKQKQNIINKNTLSIIDLFEEEAKLNQLYKPYEDGINKINIKYNRWDESLKQIERVDRRLTEEQIEQLAKAYYQETKIRSQELKEFTNEDRLNFLNEYARKNFTNLDSNFKDPILNIFYGVSGNIGQNIDWNGSSPDEVYKDEADSFFSDLYKLGKQTDIYDNKSLLSSFSPGIITYLTSQLSEKELPYLTSFINTRLDKTITDLVNVTETLTEQEKQELQESYAEYNGYKDYNSYLTKNKELKEGQLIAFKNSAKLMETEEEAFKEYIETIETSNLNAGQRNSLKTQNSFELSFNDLIDILNTDESQQSVEQIKKALDEAGKSWESLNEFAEKVADNYLKNAKNLDEIIDKDQLTTYIQEEVIPTFLRGYSALENLKEAEIDEKSLENAQKIPSKALINMTKNMETAFVRLGRESSNEILAIYEKIINSLDTEQVDKFSEAIFGIDWSTTDITKLTSKIEDLGIEADFVQKGDIQNLINKIAAIGVTASQVNLDNLNAAIDALTGIKIKAATTTGASRFSIPQETFNLISGFMPEKFKKGYFSSNEVQGVVNFNGTENDFKEALNGIADNIDSKITDAAEKANKKRPGIVRAAQRYNDEGQDFLDSMSEQWKKAEEIGAKEYMEVYTSELPSEVKERINSEYNNLPTLGKKLAYIYNLSTNNVSSDEVRQKLRAFRTSSPYITPTNKLVYGTGIFNEGDLANAYLLRAEELGIDQKYTDKLREAGPDTEERREAADLLGKLITIYENEEYSEIDKALLHKLAEVRIQETISSTGRLSLSSDETAKIYQDIARSMISDSGYSDIGNYKYYKDNLFKAIEEFKNSNAGNEAKLKLSEALLKMLGLNTDDSRYAAAFSNDDLLSMANRVYLGDENALQEYSDALFEYITNPANGIMQGVNDAQQEAFGKAFDLLKGNGANLKNNQEELAQFEKAISELYPVVNGNIEILRTLFALAGYVVDFYEEEGQFKVTNIYSNLNRSIASHGYDIVEAVKRAKKISLEDDEEDDDKKSKKWINPYDELYNLNLEINGTINYRLKLEKEHNNLLRKQGATLDKITGSFNQQIKALEREKRLYERQREIAVDQLKNFNTHVFTMDDGTKFTIDSAGLGQFIFDKANVILGDEEAGDELEKIDNYLFQLCNLLFEADLDEDQGKALQIIIKYLEGVYQNLAESEMKQLEVADSIRDLRQQAIDSYLSFEERVMDAYVSSKEDEIDAIEKAAEGFKESNSKLISKLQKQVSDQRQDRENGKTERSIYDKESRLAYLRRDTSGVNQLEIMQLEKELEEERENYGDELVDQAIDRLKEETDIAAEQRDTQIEIMRAQLDYDIQTGALWGEVYRLIDEARNADGSFRLDSELAELLRKQEGYYAMSYVGQQEFNKNLITEYNTAMQMYSNTLAASINNWGSQIKNAIDNLNQKNNTPTPTPGAGLSNSIGTPQLGGNPKSLLWGEVDISGYSPYLQNLYKQGQWAPESARQNLNGSIYLQGIGNPTDTTAYTYGYAGGLQYYNGNNNNNNNNINLQDLFATAAQYWSSGTYPGPNASDLELFAYNAIRDAFLNTPSIEFLYGKDKTYSDMLKNPYLFQAWSDYFNASTSNYFKRYASGGLVPFTGPAWLDGTYSNPEMVLSPDDTRNLISLRDILREFESDGEFANSFGDTYYDIDINADIGSDYDVDQLAERIKKQITDSASYRNINTMSFIR